MIDRDIHQLPDDYDPFEKALSAVGHRLLELDLPFDVIMDPWRTPVPFLPVLAQANSVDIWSDGWAEEKRRWVIANWPEFEAAKGTLGGLEDFVRLVGAEVLQVLVPPDDMFWEADQTPEERRAYLEKFPQLRVYPFFPEARHSADAFAGSDMAGEIGAFWDDAILLDEGPENLFRRQAVLYDPLDGTTIELTRRVRTETRFAGRYVEYDEIILPSEPSDGLFWGDVPDAYFVGADNGADRLVLRHAVDRTSSYAVSRAQINTIAPSLDPVSLEPELVGETVPLRPGDACLDAESFWDDAHVPENDSWRHVYERTFLFDPDRFQRAVGYGGTFWDAGRLGLPAKHAVAKIDITDRQPIFAADDAFWDEELSEPDLTRYDAVLTAADKSRALRDTLLIDTRTHRPRRVGDPIVLGQSRVGDRVPDRF